MLGTSRHTLRPPASSDVDVFHSIWGDPEVIWWGASEDPAETATRLDEFLGRVAGHSGLGWWLVVLDETGEVIGDVALEPSTLPAGEVEIGWHFKKEHWGGGHAIESAAALLGHAFTAAGLHEVVSTIVPMNTRSVSLAERLGMTRRPGIFMRSGLTHGVWGIHRSTNPDG